MLTKNNINFIIEEIENKKNNKNNENNENIENNENNENKFNIEDFLHDIDDYDFQDEMLIPTMLNYEENFTVKELLLICEYYGFAKELKNNKCNKNQIISFLAVFESDPNNSEIVFKRQNLWFYINELKSDKFMKKFILW